MRRAFLRYAPRVQEVESLPRIVDRYELLSVLGSGGFATVYRARHVHTHQSVAVKILHPRSGVDRWLSEARAAASVQHRNVVRVLDCGQAGDDVFIVMDLVEGQTLADVLQAGPLPVMTAVGIAVQILDGLAAAHARSIVHRDIKPPNILLTRDTDGSDLPKILDFGVSKQLTEISGTLDGTAIGTPGYMAPELFGGARYADPRVDIYAVAVTLYEMLAGKLPFAARTYEELVVQVATTRPVPLHQVAPHVPLAIASSVDRGLARDREARWETADQFAMALRGGLVGVTSPSSHAFEPTMHAPSSAPRNSAQTPPPPVPTLGPIPDPSTLRTAPPPVVSTASRNERRSSSALVWVATVLGVVLAAGAGGALVVWRVMKSEAPASVAATATQTVATSPPRENDHSLDPPPSATSTAASPPPTATATATTTTAIGRGTHSVTGGAGVAFITMETVGAIKSLEVDDFTKHAVASAQRCRPPHGNAPAVARVKLVGIHDNGEIAIVTPAPPDQVGDPIAARCIGNVLKSIAGPTTLHPSGGGGIATVEATLDPL
jgi:serine/threonine-protein kinase